MYQAHVAVFCEHSDCCPAALGRYSFGPQSELEAWSPVLGFPRCHRQFVASRSVGGDAVGERFEGGGACLWLAALSSSRDWTRKVLGARAVPVLA